jgi:hypothetical protein
MNMENLSRDTVTRLGKLHTRGVELRNEGSRIRFYDVNPFKRQEAISDWKQSYFDWKREVVDLLMPDAPATAQRIQTLNRIPEKGVYRFWFAISKEHRLHLRTMERRLEILEEILAQVSGTDWKLLPHHGSGSYK